MHAVKNVEKPTTNTIVLVVSEGLFRAHTPNSKTGQERCNRSLYRCSSHRPVWKCQQKYLVWSDCLLEKDVQVLYICPLPHSTFLWINEAKPDCWIRSSTSATGRGRQSSLHVIDDFFPRRVKRFIESLMVVFILVVVFLDQERSRDIVVGIFLVEVWERVFVVPVKRVCGKMIRSGTRRWMCASALQEERLVSGVYSQIVRVIVSQTTVLEVIVGMLVIASVAVLAVGRTQIRSDPIHRQHLGLG